MKQKFGIIALLALILLPAGVLAAGTQGSGYGSQSGAELSAPAGSVQAPALTASEISWLTQMREEEKLARDVYLTLYATHNLDIFRTIAASEQKHMDAIKTLLDRYTIPDPTAGRGVGEFSPEFQDLYDDLVLQGSAGRAEALRAGVLIEEMDISDLNAAIAASTHRDIITTYSNLRQGSLNHLAAFTSRLAKY